MTRPDRDAMVGGSERRAPTPGSRFLLAAAILVGGAGWTIGGTVLLFQMLWESGSNGTFRYHLASVVLFVPVVGTLVAVVAAVAPSRWRRVLWIVGGALAVTWVVSVVYIGIAASS